MDLQTTIYLVVGASFALYQDAVVAVLGTRERLAGAKAAGLTMNIEHGPINVPGMRAWQDRAFRVTDASGATVDAGKYLSVLEKRDGAWRLVRDIYNSDGKPAPADLGAPDSVTADPAHYKVEFENDKVRVVRIHYGPKEKSVMHSHPAGVVVFLSDLDGQFTWAFSHCSPLTAHSAPRSTSTSTPKSKAAPSS